MKVNEENFIKYLQKKNDKAIEYVIDAYGDLINSIVKKHLQYNLQHMREECINDVFLAIWYGIDNFDEDRNSFKNWVAGITKFKVIDYQRRYYKSVAEERVDELQIREDKALEEEVFKEIIDEPMDKLLSNLKADERKIFTDYYVKEKNIEEIAEAFNLEQTAIYNRLSRTRHKLRVICGGK